jgi:hypothetical protein
MSATTSQDQGLGTEQLPAAVHPTDEGLLNQVLQVYRPQCRYLTGAEISVGETGLAVAAGQFAIPESFYIQDTGHFNAVEFNLCFNQLFYYAVALCVQEGLMPPFADWTPDDFRRRQLADFLIVDFRSSFRKAVQAKSFHGEISFQRVRGNAGGPGWQPMILVDTTCRFWDDLDGLCTGQVRLVVTNPPQPLR